MGKKRCHICKLKPANSRMSHHHLTPRYSGHIGGRFHANGIRKDKTPMCKDCHDAIHQLFTNEELYHEFNSLPALKEELKVRLISQVMNGFSFLTETADEHGAVAPILERGSCKPQVAGENPVSAFPAFETFGGSL